jgi:hypothetical protein
MNSDEDFKLSGEDYSCRPPQTVTEVMKVKDARYALSDYPYPSNYTGE